MLELAHQAGFSSPEDELAAFFDPYGNAAHCALEFDVIGEDVLITGAGPIGIIAAGICKHVGARNVVVTDVNDYRLGLALKMGASRAVNVGKQELRAVMEELGMVEGFDVGLEMSGVPGAFRQMLEAMNHGGKVALLLASANRDDRRWPRADVFDVARDTSEHVGLGVGIHHCLGAALARLEGRIALEEMLAAMPRFSIDYTGLQRMHSGNVRGYSRVPIAAGCTFRNASWRLPVVPPPTGPVLMRGRELRLRPSARTPSTVMTIESESANE